MAFQQKMRPSLILGADIVYVQQDASALSSLIETIDELLGESSEAKLLLSYRQRAVGEETFFSAMQDLQCVVESQKTAGKDTVFLVTRASVRKL